MSKKSKKIAYAWTEKVTYVECPECNNVIELGNDMIFNDEKEYADECLCGAEFTYEPPPERK